MSMAGLGTKDEVIRLATIYRTEKKIEPNWRNRSRKRTLYEPSNELDFGDLSQRILTDGPNAQRKLYQIILFDFILHIKPFLFF